MLRIKALSSRKQLLWLFLLALACFTYGTEFSATPKNSESSSIANGTEILKSLSNTNQKENLRSESAEETVDIDYDEEQDDDDDDDDDEVTGERPKHSRKKLISIIKRVGTTFTWDRWEKWTKCSNSCVQIRRRKCIERKLTSLDAAPIDREFYPEPNGLTGCRGIIKRFRLCKDEKCKAKKKRQRDEQCAAFNRIAYKEKYYNWLGYEKEHNECELFCRPSGSGMFVSMNQSVTDGTTCGRPAVYYTHYYRRKAVCVEGVCRAVHESGAIRPATTSDAQTKCGSVLCEMVSEVFSKAKLSYGYNYVHTIPAGAMNLTVKQLARSDNLLALKTTDDIFLINGNNRASESGIFEYNDDSYDYNRELSIITAKGPISKPVVLLLFVRGHNTGIKYDYTLPVPSASIAEEEELQSQWNEVGQPLDELDENTIDGSVSAQIARARERKRRKFSWKLLGFGECNRSCGPGIQPPIFRCIRDLPTRYYSPKRCAFVEKPVFSEDIYHCNRGLCPAYWRAGEYGECKCAEGVAEGVRSRYVNCVQEQNNGKVEVVSEDLCEQEKLPQLNETCNCPKLNRRKIYARGPDKTPRVFSRLVIAPTLVRSVYNSTTPLRRHLRDDRVDKAGVWLMSGWNQECSTDCGAGFEHRSIYCDRTPPYTDLCDLRFTPEQKRICSGSQQAEACQYGTWFTSEWSNCTGDCFNLQRKRAVLCLRDGVAVDESECDLLLRPRAVMNCTHKEVMFCGPKWHYSEWSECSRSCGDGVQRRYAKCLEFDWKQKAMVESSNCKYLEREPVYGTCNVQKCEELNTLFDVERDILKPVDPPVNCKDEVSNCQRINRQRLCKLHYYKTYCCATCSGYA
ncbi:ADAMTS-like protein 3 isoform X1 [Bactrocera tryoni]|uniref:ADAMTS-like protein 3 isoform X1 n=1 Tax=Bactrocera tryoni TaxID=59916 RepID=UPI001A965522|nr:ADAMTS-like protein 3 isoform X1 [Bactrocera tryoni]